MKRRYSIALLQRYKDSNKRGYCDYFKGFRTAFVDNWQSGYQGNTRKAKQYSKQLGASHLPFAASFHEDDELLEGLAAVCVVTEESERNVLMKETFEFYEDGVLVRTETKAY